MLLIPGEPIAVVSRHTRDATPQASGAPAIAAWVAASLGTPTAFLGAVGNDDAGRLIRRTLVDAGANPATILTKDGLPTATAHVDYFPDGSRSFQFDVTGSAAIALDTDDLADLPERASWIHLSGSALMFGPPLSDVIIDAMTRGLAAGATVSIDPNLRAELDDPARLATLAQLCSRAPVVFPSAGELAALDLDEDELVARGTVVCRTMAADGARVRTAHLDLTVPAVAAADDVVDPDGAGDTFAGAAIAARLRGRDWPASVHIAARVVARAIGVPGPMSFPLGPDDLAVPDSR